MFSIWCFIKFSFGTSGVAVRQFSVVPADFFCFLENLLLMVLISASYTYFYATPFRIQLYFMIITCVTTEFITSMF